MALLKNLINLFKSPRPSAEIQDVRSRRFVAVIDCILNQNARDCGAARFPAMNFELLQLCHAHNVGILQMPCPEMAALGFKRVREPGQSIREALDSDSGRRRCAELAGEVANRIEAYLAEGYELLAILGGNPRSPGCAVLNGEDGLLGDSGVFMQELQAELRKRRLPASFRGIRDHDPELLAQDLLRISDFLSERPA